MKIMLSALVLCCCALHLFGQKGNEIGFEKRNCLTVGILQGGGSLVGVDLETLLSDRLGVQIGGGFVGFGGAVNYHFRPNIRSSFISFSYWHQGIGNSYAQSVLGPSYVFRGEKWFTGQLGIGLPLEKGPALPDNFVLPPVMLLYSIGFYIPL